MTELLTAAQMRAIEQAAIESGDVTGLELMERAGQGVVEAIFEEWPKLDTPGKRAVVLCGPGNNGGDGFVVARLLKARGWEVEVFLYGDPARLPPDAKANYERWLALGEVATRDFMREPFSDDDLRGADGVDLLVDALFGTGLKRPLCGFTTARSLVAEKGGRVVAVDLPSGVCSESGRSLGAAIAAELTVTFHLQKLGHFLGNGPELCGKLVVKEIGLKGGDHPPVAAKARPSPEKHRSGADGGCPAVPPGDIVQLVKPSLISKGSGHKFSHGHALILTGGAGKTGAARLSARGALRIGAGLVTLGVPPSAQQEVACQITALMLERVADADALVNVLEDRRINALCLGPGMGLDRAREFVPAALAAKRATVLDADALSAFGDAPEELFAMLHETCVLTPHGGEFARLFPDIAEKLNAPAATGPAYSKMDATREAAARAGCVVLFKGADTVIAAPYGRCSVNSAHYDRAAPWLATAGSGDVLAGFITGLMARGFNPMQAAESAACLHVDCALEFGPGLIAEDLPEQIPAVFRKLGL